jgi:hypothetical protein
MSAACAIGAFLPFRTPPKIPAQTGPSYPSLTELAAMSPTQLGNVDIALMNLRCAERLPGSEDLDVRTALGKLDEFAQHVDTETVRNLHRFREKPSEFENSEAYFRLMVMATVLAEDFSVHYNPDFKNVPGIAPTNDSFGSNSRDIFIHGLTNPPMTGTCASMPVFYVAIGRRLGYPLYLVPTKGHLFFRWENSRARLNVDATAEGLVTSKDDYYKTWPFKVTDAEIEAEGYLKSMTPAEALAAFLCARGHCLMKAGRCPEAVAAHQAAVRLAPEIHQYQLDLKFVEHRASEQMMSQIDQVDWLLDRKQRRNSVPASAPPPFQ